MRPLVLTPKLKRAYRKFTRRNAGLKARINQVLTEYGE